MDYQNTPQLPPSGKLVLPAPASTGEEARMLNGSQKTPVLPEHLIQHKIQPPPKQLFARLNFYWRKDPAYKVFMIAAVMVLLAGTVLIYLASNALLQNANLFSQGYANTQGLTTGVIPAGTTDVHPIFPTPGGGQGSNQNSQPPMQNTPTLRPTVGDTSPTPQASPTAVTNGALTVQITDIPNPVANGSKVSVGVMTSEPKVTVLLVVSYNVYPYRYYSSQHTTNENRNASLPWRVEVTGYGTATATVYVLAYDQNGQQAQSDPVTVQVI